MQRTAATRGRSKGPDGVNGALGGSAAPHLAAIPSHSANPRPLPLKTVMMEAGTRLSHVSLIWQGGRRKSEIPYLPCLPVIVG